MRSLLDLLQRVTPAGATAPKASRRARRASGTADARAAALQLAKGVRPRNRDRLVILRMGLGRDSMAMLCLLAEHRLVADGELCGPEDVDAVVFTDPGYEWPASYALIGRVEAFCRKIGVPFLVQAKPPDEGPRGWIAWLSDRSARKRALAQAGEETRLGVEDRPWQIGAPALPVRRKGDTGAFRAAEMEVFRRRCAMGYYHDWPPILETYMAKEMVIKMKDAGCTDNHKIAPNRRMLSDLARVRFGVPDNGAWSREVSAGRRPPHLVLLGIAADEAKRAEKMSKGGPGYEHNAYPLLEMGLSRKDEDAILARHGFADVQKSGCMFCKYQDAGWFWALSVLAPEVFSKVVRYEQVALQAAAREGRPRSDALILKGGPTLTDHVTTWRREHPEATPAEVLRNEYRSCASRYATKRAGASKQQALPLPKARSVRIKSPARRSA